jgi:hypothetical protein
MSRTSHLGGKDHDIRNAYFCLEGGFLGGTKIAKVRVTDRHESIAGNAWSC